MLLNSKIPKKEVIKTAQTRMTGIAIIFAMFLTSISAIITVYGSLFHWFVGFIVPIMCVIGGLLLLMAAYTKLNKNQAKKKILNKTNALIIGTTLICNGIMLLVLQSILYSALGFIIGFAWIFFI